ncbi:MAG: peptide MFS transporter [Bacteroidaceae bacterium]|nr:peptide MFS transporter [Bacteroidaceae bacterium]
MHCVKHPKGLYLLFITEMAERFSYYGMRALFTLYMVAVLFTMEDASEIYGTYTGLVYLTPLLGGYIADRYWGNRRSIIVGGLVMAVGQFLMFLSACLVQQSISAEGGAIDASVDNQASVILMFCALGCLILGNGFFKPNISTMVGDLYDAQDKRKDSAFTIFYMGINLGAFIAPLVCGCFEGNFSDPSRFRWGFLIACLAMIVSVVIFALFKKRYLVTPNGEPIGLAPTAQHKEKHQGSQPLTSREKAHIGVIFIVATFVIFFWAAYEQAGVSLTYFTDSQTDRTLFGWTVPTSWFQSLPAIFCVILAPVMAMLWEMLGKCRIGSSKSLEQSSVQKQAIGLAFLSLGYLVIALGVKDIDPTTKVSMLWITSLYFIHELGELSLSPIGLSMVSKLSPKRFASLLMGVWFMSTAASNFLAGKLSTLYPDGGAAKSFLGYEVSDLNDFFMLFVIMAGVASVLLFIISPKLNKMMK